MEPVVDHIEITVKDMATAVPFYDALMPLLGFDLARKSRAYLETWDFDVVEYSHPRLGFAINSPRASVAGDDVHRRRPGSVHHIAFRAASRGEVDRIHGELVRIGATIVDGPRVFPEHTPAGYYAVFFKDPGGIKFEVVHTPEQ
ncbi:MAG: VOC family protein [Planctomycetota bacterium]